MYSTINTYKGKLTKLCAGQASKIDNAAFLGISDFPVLFLGTDKDFYVLCFYRFRKSVENFRQRSRIVPEKLQKCFSRLPKKTKRKFPTSSQKGSKKYKRNKHKRR